MRPQDRPHGLRRVLPVGCRALLVECRDGGEVRGLHAALLADPLPGQGELLPAARTLLVRLDRLDSDGALARRLAVLPVRAVASTVGREVVLDTVYDGEDLAEVARLLGRSVEAVVRAHAAGTWTAAFVGFAPGFAYLERDGGSLDVPRRSSPRTAVPAGSVALAGPYSAVYPRSSPGGWQLIGRTDARMWDLSRPEPALVTAGTRVRFRPVRVRVTAGPGGAGSGDVAAPSPRDGQDPAPAAVGRAPEVVGRALEVVASGVQSLVEDLGRPGHLALGVGPSGSLDRAAAVRANRLVGNARGAALVETVLGGLVLRAHGDHVLAVTGAPAPSAILSPDGAERDRPAVGGPFALRDGESLVLAAPRVGLRSYVAVRGGVAVSPVLGSRATDLLSGLGPPPLASGAVLPVGTPPGEAVAGWPDPAETWTTTAGHGEPVTIRVVAGPRDDWLTGEGRRHLLEDVWTVTAESNRVGLRLAGPPLVRAVDAELPSEGVVAGAVQVPPSGQPVVFLADHPVTGGYPVAAVVVDADRDRLAQVRAGDRVRFDARTSGVRARPARP